ncbi:adeC/adeK/oprM family multidrug efflux complex outer membrane factor [Marinobacterium zhoushanense]|uniref:AdeC/adeK/oprM family multidrug efflux complex outer membrane factor n=1 Tax=Marinobacterium zhoushanense TaxID=1679163 RepID=A0ABQ1K1Q3_9GAMM|nr:TolC family protein [Marinobacterium zhoushanense]GGB84347.1 adeC/adeK/oprM family multidrug efflux complex outer membrane factor [Marinobacterium zhoushanense]
MGSATHLTELINSQELQSLVSEALANNPGLQQTLLALEQSKTQLRQKRGDRYPELEAGFSASNTKDSDSQYTGSLTLNWQLDLWQHIEDGINAAEQSQFQQQETYQAARDTLASETMSSWLSLISQKRSLAIERQRLNTLERNEQFILQRYQRGLGTLDDLDSARSSTLSTRASARELEQSIREGERALNSLLGRVTDNPYQVPDEYPNVEKPLAELPEQTLARRPDLQAAWHAIAAAEKDASVAYKDLLPRIDVQAALEDIAASPGDALLTDPVWSLLGQLTAPLFQGGKLKAAVEIANLESAIQYQNYRETLLTAVEEVRNALAREQALSERQAYIQQALETQRLTLTRYQDKYRAGNATILELLDVQGQTYDLEAQLDTLTFNRLDNRITLALALGLGVTE